MKQMMRLDNARRIAANAVLARVMYLILVSQRVACKPHDNTPTFVYHSVFAVSNNSSLHASGDNFCGRLQSDAFLNPSVFSKP